MAAAAEDDPVAVAAAYARAGADEIFVRARALTPERLIEWVRRVARDSQIPLTVQAEPVRSTESVGELLVAGASRVAVRTAVLADPDLIARWARPFGSESVAVLICVQRDGRAWRVLEGPGGRPTEWEATTWARVVEAQGGGEIVLEAPPGEPDESLDLLQEMTGAVARPVLAAGPLESAEAVFDALMVGGADGVLLGSLLHSGRESVSGLKRYLDEHGLEVRPVGE